MDIVKKFLSVFLSGSLALSASALTNDQTTAASDNEMVAYLFTYFNSNAPEDEQICYAISDDGYNYTPLNQGLPVISSDTIALTQCVRDPHILRCEDGKTFYMVCTDMRSQLGWSSNRGIVLLKSTDLIHWQHSTVNFPTRYTKTWKNVIRVWAPETIYDRQAGKYMVFYSLRTSDPGSTIKNVFYHLINYRLRLVTSNKSRYKHCGCIHKHFFPKSIRKSSRYLIDYSIVCFHYLKIIN